jgi:hypothetical protein
MPYTNVYIFRTKGTKSFSIKVADTILPSLYKFYQRFMMKFKKKINDKNQT